MRSKKLWDLFEYFYKLSPYSRKDSPASHRWSVLSQNKRLLILLHECDYVDIEWDDDGNSTDFSATVMNTRGDGWNCVMYQFRMRSKLMSFSYSRDGFHLSYSTWDGHLTEASAGIYKRHKKLFGWRAEMNNDIPIYVHHFNGWAHAQTRYRNHIYHQWKNIAHPCIRYGFETDYSGYPNDPRYCSMACRIGPFGFGAGHLRAVIRSIQRYNDLGDALRGGPPVRMVSRPYIWYQLTIGSFIERWMF